MQRHDSPRLEVLCIPKLSSHGWPGTLVLLLAITHSTTALEQACSALLDPEAIDSMWQFKTHSMVSELDRVHV